MSSGERMKKPPLPVLPAVGDCGWTVFPLDPQPEPYLAPEPFMPGEYQVVAWFWPERRDGALCWYAEEDGMPMKTLARRLGLTGRITDEETGAPSTASAACASDTPFALPRGNSGGLGAGGAANGRPTSSGGAFRRPRS